METKLLPYLTFENNAREAMEFYKSVFGGELTVQTFGQAFPETPEENKNLTMHAQLTAPDFVIMASDNNPEYGPKLSVGNNVNLSINGFEEEKITGFFNKLSEGGKIDMPLEKQFWGDKFGMLADKFSIHWMINF